MLTLLMMLAGGDVPPAQADMVATAHRLTGIERCERRLDDTDITVCGLRNADRFRVPFVVHDPDSRRYRSVAAEREELIHRRTPMEDLGPFLVEGGMAGVSASVGATSSLSGYRKLAP